MTTIEDDLTRRARALPRELTPERDLWPEIEAGLVPRPAAWVRWRRPLAMAASLLVAVSVGYWLGGSADREPVLPGTSTAIGTGIPPGDFEAMPAAGVGGVDPELHRVRAALAAALRERLDSLPEQSRLLVEDNLAAINRALDEIDQALIQTPRSGMDQRLLMAMYTDQLLLLSTMNDLIRNPNLEMTL